MSTAWAIVFVIGWLAVIALCIWMMGGRFK